MAFSEFFSGENLVPRFKFELNHFIYSANSLVFNFICDFVIKQIVHYRIFIKK